MPRFDNEMYEKVYEGICEAREKEAMEAIDWMLANQSHIADWCLEVKIPEHSEDSE